MILQRHRGTEDRHHPSPVNPLAVVHRRRRPLHQIGHDRNRSMSRPRCPSTHIGAEQHRDLLMRGAGLAERGWASHSRGRTGRSPAVQHRRTRTPCRLRSWQNHAYWLAAVMSIAHANIVSPLASPHVRITGAVRVAALRRASGARVRGRIPVKRQVERVCCEILRGVLRSCGGGSSGGDVSVHRCRRLDLLGGDRRRRDAGRGCP